MNRPLCPCRHPGCASLVTSGYCEKHTRSTGKVMYDATRRKDDPALANAARIRNSAQWQKVRAIHRAQHPLCCDPFNDVRHPAPNQTSHHIMPLATHPHLAFDLDNLAPLCTRCHAKVERIERNGDATAHLFNYKRDGSL